jgi:GT2 family glycosyltransferase
MLLSIITLTYNRRDYIRTLHRSLCNTTVGLDFEWLIGDSGEDDTCEVVTQFGDSRLRTFRVPNSGFAFGQNELSKHARGDLLLFLNNDTVLLPGWWGPMIETAHQFGRSVVGPRILEEDGTLQSLGMGFDPAREEVTYNLLAEDFERWPACLEGVYRVAALTGACMLVQRSLYAELNGFDETYAGGYYEDTDFCLRALAVGANVLVSGRSAIIHIGKGTLAISKAYWGHIARNRDLFRTRWGIAIRRLSTVKPLPATPIFPTGRVAVLDRWLSTLGGGEYELLIAALILARHCESVGIFYGAGSNGTLQAQFAVRFNIALPGNVFLRTLDEFDAGQYDIIWDQNYYDLQTNYHAPRRWHFKRVMFGPPQRVPAEGPTFLVNSFYTRSCLPKLPNSYILYPPVPLLSTFRSIHGDLASKEALVLSVGRFANRMDHLNWKNQPALIEAFASLPAELRHTYELVIIGHVEDPEFFERCRSSAEQLTGHCRIRIIGNATRAMLESYYKRSKVFVTCCGYQGSTLANAEHFGIALAEAMSAGCICLAHSSGGHAELLRQGISGFLWSSLDELRKLLIEVTIGSATAGDQSRIGLQAFYRSLQFSRAFFEMEIESLLLHAIESAGLASRRA